MHFVAKLYPNKYTDLILIGYSKYAQHKIHSNFVIFVRGQTDTFEKNKKVILKMFKNSLSFILGVGRGLI